MLHLSILFEKENQPGHNHSYFSRNTGAKMENPENTKSKMKGKMHHWAANEITGFFLLQFTSLQSRLKKDKTSQNTADIKGLAIYLSFYGTVVLLYWSEVATMYNVKSVCRIKWEGLF